MQSTLHQQQRPTSSRTVSSVLTIAGSDSSGGAGIEADLKTFSAHGCYGATCITALTAQNSAGVWAVVETAETQLRQTVDAVMQEFGSGRLQLKVIKIGMLTRPAIVVVELLLGRFRQLGIRMVVDPVMVSTSGVTLADDPTMKLCMDAVIPSAYLCTPNVDEAKKMGGRLAGFGDVQEFQAYAQELRRLLGCENLLLKGGHAPFAAAGDSRVVVDVLVTPLKVSVFKLPFIVCPNSHGTGCTLSSAIAANLSKGMDLESAVERAIDYVHRAMSLDLGRLDHLVGSCVSGTTEACSDTKACSDTEACSGTEACSVSDSPKDTTKAKLLAHGVPFLNDLKQSLRWEAYTRHPVVAMIANDTLPKSRFLNYLKQDYHYLQTYARIHGCAIAVAKTCEQLELHSQSLHSILEELKRHQAKFKGSLRQPSRACIQYCDYLTQVSKTEDILGIQVALAPCLHGYAEAGRYGLAKRIEYLQASGSDGDQMYSDWLADYTSDWYTSAHVLGMQALQKLLEEERPDEARMGRLREIFRTVTDLEIAFWDEVLEEKEV